MKGGTLLLLIGNDWVATGQCAIIYIYKGTNNIYYMYYGIYITVYYEILWYIIYLAYIIAIDHEYIYIMVYIIMDIYI